MGTRATQRPGPSFLADAAVGSQSSTFLLSPWRKPGQLPCEPQWQKRQLVCRLAHPVGRALDGESQAGCGRASLCTWPRRAASLVMRWGLAEPLLAWPLWATISHVNCIPP